jgi:uncharacterized membrane protein YbhN (UPF0104 family)
MPWSFTARRLVFPLKCLISAALLYWLFSRIHPGAAIAVLAHTKLSYLPAALALLLVAQFLSSVRWGLLARSVGFTNSFVDFTTFYWIGMFFNLFLPSTVGGDIGKTFYLVQSRPAASSVLQWTGRAATSVISDRAVGLIALVWMAAISIIIVPVAKLPESVRSMTFFLAIAFSIAGLLLPYLCGFLRRLGYTFGKSVAEALDIYRRDLKLATFVVLLAVAIHLLTSALYLPIAWSLGVDLPGPYLFTTYAIVTLVSTLPITFYGIGIRESALVFMLAPVGVPGGKALAFGVLLFLVLFTANLGGGVVFLLQRRGSRRPA